MYHVECESSERFLRKHVALATEKCISLGGIRERGAKPQRGALIWLLQLQLLNRWDKSEADAGLGRVALTA